MGFDLNICGCRGSFPTFKENFQEFGQDTSCYVIKEDDYALIMDCGTGLYNAIKLFKDCKKIDILLTHLHYDHIMGLFDSENFLKDKNVTFYGLFKEWFSENDDKKMYKADDFIKGKYLEAPLYTKFNLHNGFEAKFSLSLHGEHAVMIELFKDKKHIVYTGDYEHNGNFNIGDKIRDCDILLFDGSYSKDEYRNYRNWGHSTWETGCMLAKRYNVKKLIITHHAPFHDDEYLTKCEKKAKSLYGNTIFARQNSVVKL